MDTPNSPLSPPLLVSPSRRHSVTLKLLLIAALIVLLHVPLFLLSGLRAERARTFRISPEAFASVRAGKVPVTDSYRMVERSLKYAVFVMALIFAAFFLFETLTELRLHAVHYGLVGAALCLFYLALLALGEVLGPEAAYVGAAFASSLLIVLYSASILRNWLRAAVMAGLLVFVHGVLYVVLRMESYALLAGTAALFAALAAIMYFTRKVDWLGEKPMAAKTVG